MSRTLPARQAEELHKSIIAYLAANNLHSSAAALREELSLSEDVYDAATAKKYESLLEKKWTSIVRLQKKIMELETRNAYLQSELDNATPTSISKRNTDPASWLPRTPARHSMEGHRDTVNCVAFHPKFTSLASGSEDCTIKIWDWELGEAEQTVKGHTRAVLDLDYGGPKTAILLASCSSDLTIKLWDPADGYKNIRTLSGHDHSVSAVRFIPSGSAGVFSSGNMLVSASGDRTLKIWDATTGYCVKTLSGHSDWVRDVCPSPDGNYLISTSADHMGRLWDLTLPNPETKATMVGHEHVVQCCAFAPPSAYQHLAAIAGLKKPPPTSSPAEFMATGSRDKTIRLWDSRGTCLKVLVGHDNWINALVFHPSGKYLLSAADDKSIRCWDLAQEAKCVKTLADAHERFVKCLRWAPSIAKDGAATTAVTNGGGHGEAGGEVGAIKKLEADNAHIRCVIATGGVDQMVKVWAN
ncbi:Dynein regulator [Cordyceps fumosorosea ARSEF 2679]|uniref:Nuclear distribution protein PAC1 n=1 Tax=Cordyceps fumosorosea (strain ARSEF 2679) TaxID=1081104 RepID=A0A168E3P2_CORFA|nr:Dynein regulator [Cordyceps fumosorosea ARSEF 2679]OAA73337.1 Dynein regulator [Cordyceps fumosorosea ARSEF 2679]